MLTIEQVKFLDNHGWPCFLATGDDRDETGSFQTVRLYLVGFSQPGEMSSVSKMFSGSTREEAYAAAAEFVLANPRRKSRQGGHDLTQHWKDALRENYLARQYAEVSSFVTAAPVVPEPVDPLDGL